eukprot:GHVL01006863.1.p1 GENE.GHVL01006863.1~~GHVL01006863.1.p1  ORF type:complete len:176 (+),score=24.98 GHVL01006863.1:39-566(+)
MFKAAENEGSEEDPYYLNVLVNNIAARSIIGYNGSEMEAIKKRTGVSLWVAPAGEYYRDTKERLVEMGGTKDNLIDGLHLILEAGSSAMSPTDLANNAYKCRLVVPSCVLSCNIFPRGQFANPLERQTGASVNISQESRKAKESIVNISGNMEQIESAVSKITSAVESESYYSHS